MGTEYYLADMANKEYISLGKVRWSLTPRTFEIPSDLIADFIASRLHMDVEKPEELKFLSEHDNPPWWDDEAGWKEWHPYWWNGGVKPDDD